MGSVNRFSEKVLRLGYGAWASRLVQVAVKLQIFKVLEEGSETARDLAQRLGLEPRATELFLNALAGLGLLQERKGRFQNRREGRKVLVPGGEKYLGDIVALGDRGWELWGDLERALRTGKPLDIPEFFKTERERVEAFIRAMDNTAKGHADLLARSISLKGRKTLLDVGGGSGAFTLAFLKRNRNLRATIFDLPQTIQVTRTFVEQSPFRDRVECRTGDLTRDDFGGRFDVVFISHILHGLSEEENQALLRKVYPALVPKGIVLLQDFFLNSDRTSPPFAAVFALNMLIHTPKGRSYSRPEVIHWLRQAGFGRVATPRLKLPRDISILRAEKLESAKI